MTESEMVKLCVVLIPIVAMVLATVVECIIEAVGNYKYKDCFKDEEAQALLKHCQGGKDKNGIKL